MSKEKDLRMVLALDSGVASSCVICGFSGGGFEVTRVRDVFVVHEIPLYGGEPSFLKTFFCVEAEALVNFCYSLA